jgi:hypothetical protein
VNTCKTCKHWQRRNDAVIGACSKIVPWCGDFMHKAVVHYQVSYYSGMLNHTTDTSKVWTGQDFGCIHHEPKEVA